MRSRDLLLLAIVLTLSRCSATPLGVTCDPASDERRLSCTVTAVAGAEVRVEGGTDEPLTTTRLDSSAGFVGIDLSRMNPDTEALTFIARGPRMRTAEVKVPVSAELRWASPDSRPNGARGVIALVRACSSCVVTIDGRTLARGADGTFRLELDLLDVSPRGSWPKYFDAPLVVQGPDRKQSSTETILAFPQAASDEARAQVTARGKPIEWAASLQRGAGPRPTLLVGKDEAFTSLNGLKRLRDLEVVAFVETTWEVVETCGPYGGFAYVNRTVPVAKVELYEAKTAARITTQAFRGTTPRACAKQETITFNGQVVDPALAGTEPAPAAIDAWIAAFVPVGG